MSLQMYCVQCEKNPVLDGFKLCVDCLKLMLPDSFSERRKDHPEPTPKESALESAYNKMVSLICVKCENITHKQGSHPIMIHYACYTDVRFRWFKWGVIWGIIFGLILAIFIVG